MTMLRAEFEVEEEIIQQSISESKLLDRGSCCRTAGRWCGAGKRTPPPTKREGARQPRGNDECRKPRKKLGLGLANRRP